MNVGSKISVKTSVLKQAIERTDSVVDSGANPVALRFVKMTFIADERILVLESCETEGKSGVQCSIPVSIPEMISENFSVLVDPKIASKILSRLRVDEVVLQPMDNNTKLIIKTQRHKFELNAVSPSEFPSFPKSNSGKVFSISATTLKKMLTIVHPSINKNDARISLTGVCFNYFNKNVYIVGMSGTLGLFCSKEVELSKNDFEIIIPHNALIPLIKHLPDGEDCEIEYTLSDISDVENSDIINIFFKTSTFSVVVKTFSKEFSRYPNWDRIVPGGIKDLRKDEIESYFLIDKDSLSEVISLAASVADMKKPKVKIIYEVEDETNGKLTVRGFSEIGIAELDSINCHHLGGKDGFEIELNNNYVETVLSAIGTKEVQVRFGGKDRPLGLICDSSGELFVGSVIVPIEESSNNDDEEEVLEEEQEELEKEDKE